MSQDFPSYRGQMEYRCLGCGKTHPGDSLLYTCPDCGGVFLLHDNNFDEHKKHDGAYWRDVFDKRLMTRTPALRGVFAYYELLAPILEEEDIVYLGEAHTPIVAASSALQDKVGLAFSYKLLSILLIEIKALRLDIRTIRAAYDRTFVPLYAKPFKSAVKILKRFIRVPFPVSILNTEYEFTP